jgi:hypothetical protein
MLEVAGARALIVGEGATGAAVAGASPAGIASEAFGAAKVVALVSAERRPNDREMVSLIGLSIVEHRAFPQTGKKLESLPMGRFDRQA